MHGRTARIWLSSSSHSEEIGTCARFDGKNKGGTGRRGRMESVKEETGIRLLSTFSSFSGHRKITQGGLDVGLTRQTQHAGDSIVFRNLIFHETVDHFHT
jgi:hypothetical protein